MEKGIRYMIKTVDACTYHFRNDGVKFLENDSQIIIREKNGSETIFMKSNVVYACKDVYDKCKN